MESFDDNDCSTADDKSDAHPSPKLSIGEKCQQFRSSNTLKSDQLDRVFENCQDKLDSKPLNFDELVQKWVLLYLCEH